MTRSMTDALREARGTRIHDVTDLRHPGGTECYYCIQDEGARVYYQRFGPLVGRAPYRKLRSERWST